MTLDRRGILLLVALSGSTLHAQGDKTANLLSISGSRRAVTLSAEPIRDGDRDVYFGRESILLTRRGKEELRVTVAARGIPEIDLFPDDPAAAPTSSCASSPRNYLEATLTAPMRIGYRYCIPAEGFQKAQGELLIAANNAEPERLSLEFSRPETLLESKAGTMLSSVVLVGIGALVGLGSFLLQQRITVGNQERSLFWQKKIGEEEKLTKFFKDEYPKYYRPSKSAGDQADARAIRRVLAKEGIYVMFPSTQLRKLNWICDGRLLIGHRLHKVDRLIRRNFRELMRND